MTSAYSNISTDGIPGRAWTVRITGHSGRFASVSCSTTACQMPARSQDLPKLRAFATRHAAAHARAATICPHAWCHCGSQRCGAHPDTKTRCHGDVVMILRHDPTVRQVWIVAEVCETCAPLIPNATVLARAARPSRTRDQPPTTAVTVPSPARPHIASGFSSPTALSGGGAAAPVRPPRRGPQRPRRRSSGQGQ
ncbi:hypothetical protein ACIQGT_26090 [Streptomyces sp. NPDC093108]|uniref:hypothetical protein n=1 Tax=Streptomyces sp. NPDC093108 TaxID=3366030 RepID=UPI0038267589